MRVGIVGLLHESNTFISQSTTWRHFAEDLLAEGETLRQKMSGAHHELGGFFAGLEEQQIEAVPIFAARATPYGVIEAAAWDRLFERIEACWEQVGAIDGLLAAPHGATVTENHRDADGFLLNWLRERLGADKPLIATLDPHANLSPAMVEACDALIAYRSNPHLDQRARGIEAARLMAQTLRGTFRPCVAAAFPPMAISIDRQETDAEPCRGLYELADAQLQREGVLSNSVLLGFPYADTAEMGSATLAVTNDQPQLAQALADELAAAMWERRESFAAQLQGVEEALDWAQRQTGAVCLLDMGDNVGGGSPADGTILAQAFHRRKMESSFVCLYDPQAVEIASKANVGDGLALSIGGKTDQRHGPPLEAEFQLLGIYEGRFREPQPRHGGFAECDQGRSAVLKTAHGLTVLATSRRVPPFSLQSLRCCDLDPAQFRYLAAKGVNAPIAAYREVCSHFVRVDTPGVTAADMTKAEYRYRRRPLFPFEA